MKAYNDKNLILDEIEELIKPPVYFNKAVLKILISLSSFVMSGIVIALMKERNAILFGSILMLVSFVVNIVGFINIIQSYRAKEDYNTVYFTLLSIGFVILLLMHLSLIVIILGFILLFGSR